MMPQPYQHDLKRELEATLAARREMGPEYDEQFIARLADQLTAMVRQEVARTPAPRPSGLSSEQRTAIAICSLIFGIPLVAIGGGIAGPVGLLIAFAALVLLNFFVNAPAGWRR